MQRPRLAATPARVAAPTPLRSRASITRAPAWVGRCRDVSDKRAVVLQVTDRAAGGAEQRRADPDVTVPVDREALSVLAPVTERAARRGAVGTRFPNRVPAERSGPDRACRVDGHAVDRVADVEAVWVARAVRDIGVPAEQLALCRPDDAIAVDQAAVTAAGAIRRGNLDDAGRPIDSREPAARVPASHPQLVVLIDAHVPRIRKTWEVEARGVGVEVVEDAFVGSIGDVAVCPRPRLDVTVGARRFDQPVGVPVDALVELDKADVRDAAGAAMADPDAAVERNGCPRGLTAGLTVRDCAVLAEDRAVRGIDLGDRAPLRERDPDEGERTGRGVQLKLVVVGCIVIDIDHGAPNNNQLQLNTTTSTFPFIWISLSQR